MVHVSKRQLAVLCSSALVVVIAAAAALGLYATNNLPGLHRTTRTISTVTGNAATKGEKSAVGQPLAQQPGNQNPKQDKGGTPTPNVLVAPSGTFVSSHHASLSNNPSGSDYLASTCTTTPGASCQIVFTKDGVTKSLPPQETDAGGSTYWNNWRPQDYGLTEGTWSIQAVAMLGDQKQTASDAMNLEVQP